MHPDLDLNIVEELDPDVGEVPLIAEDIGTSHPQHRQQLLLRH